VPVCLLGRVLLEGEPALRTSGEFDHEYEYEHEHEHEHEREREQTGQRETEAVYREPRSADGASRPAVLSLSLFSPGWRGQRLVSSRIFIPSRGGLIDM
jgi:hypothetical protein